MADVGHVIVVGGGIAGASAAYFLAISGKCAQVTLVEAEPQLAHHTTGRSAALLTENYGAGPVRPLTTASLDFLHHPPAALVDHPILKKRGILTIATECESYRELERQLESGRAATQPVIEIDVERAAQLAPYIAFGPDHRVMWEEHAFDIDVAGLHQCFIRGFRASGGAVHTSHRVDAATRKGDRWLVETTGGTLEAHAIVNAAGAWGDVVAERAGVAPLGLTPLRRTAFMVNSPFERSQEFAMVAEVHHRWYLRPDGPSQFMCSPADEQPSEPCDARADEIDIARTIELLNQNLAWEIRSITSHWAGLRTFAPDRAMVIGSEPSEPSFFWCVGQGGTGIQTSPGAGRLLADLVTEGSPSQAFRDIGFDLDALLPGRLRSSQVLPQD